MENTLCIIKIDFRCCTGNYKMYCIEIFLCFKKYRTTQLSLLLLLLSWTHNRREFKLASWILTLLNKNSVFYSVFFPAKTHLPFLQSKEFSRCKHKLHYRFFYVGAVMVIFQDLSSNNNIKKLIDFRVNFHFFP